MGTVENRELVRRWIEDGWNRNDNERVMREVFAEDWIDGDAPGGPHGWAGITAFVDSYRGGFPDIKIEVLQMVADSEFVAFRWRATGSHQGALFGIEPTGRKVSITGHTLHRVEGGRMKESWVQTDSMGLLSQLGVTSIPG